MLDFIKKFFSSKTVDGNILMSGIILFLKSQGVVLTPEQIVGIMGVANLILRLITKKPISEKTGFEDLLNLK